MDALHETGDEVDDDEDNMHSQCEAIVRAIEEMVAPMTQSGGPSLAHMTLVVPTPLVHAFGMY